MGLYDRDYTQEGFESRRHYAPQMGFGVGSLTPAVKWLLIANGILFLVQSMGADRFLTTWFSVWPLSWKMDLQVWRLVTYQFLHGDLLHILFNMLGLFFLGPWLEKHWGTVRFLVFYLGCGAAGGLCYILLAAINALSVGPMVGASGAILGMLAACAILFPHFVVFLVIFPVPIRLAAIILIFIAVVTLLARGANAGGEAAHLGGMTAGAVYVFSRGWAGRSFLRLRGFLHKRSLSRLQDLDREVDRILQKVHYSGIHSLTRREKATLKKATETEQRRQARL
jgi:membrane associated rhomboid family serine protease